MTRMTRSFILALVLMIAPMGVAKADNAVGKAIAASSSN
jgi:hypothetical protein